MRKIPRAALYARRGELLTCCDVRHARGVIFEYNVFALSPFVIMA